MRTSGEWLRWVVVGAWAAVASCAQRGTPQAGLAPGSRAPAFQTVGPDDSPVSLADFSGDVVVLDFWATWCGPCLQAMPEMQRLSKRFAGKGVVVLGVDTDRAGDLKRVAATIRDKGITFRQALDPEATIARSYKIDALPTVIVVDKAGVVSAVHVGFERGEADLLGDEIDRLLKKAP